jgi:hypothetical protein
MRDDNHIRHLIELYGSSTALAEAAGVNRAAVHRWPPKNGMLRKYQVKILKDAKAAGHPMDQVVWALGIQTCPCCKAIVDDEMREIANG